MSDEFQALREENTRLKRELSIIHAKSDLVLRKGRNYENPDLPLEYSGALRRVFEALSDRGCDYYGSGAAYMAQCPAHDDHSPSLKITEAHDGAALLFCFAGCKTADIVSALGLVWRDIGGRGYVRPLPGKAA